MITKKRLLIILTLLSMQLISACGGSLRTNPGNSIKTVAILPMVNNTNDVNGPKVVRTLFYKKMPSIHYQAKSMTKTDTILRDRMGITLGKQLALTTPQELGKQLGVDGLFYGYLLNFDDKVAGLYNERKVRMGWKLVDTSSGRVVWGKGIGAKRVIKTSGKIKGLVSLGSALLDKKEKEIPSLPGSENPLQEMPGLNNWVVMADTEVSFEKSIILGLGGKILEKIIGQHMRMETEFALKKLFFEPPTILAGPVARPTPD